MRAATSCQPTAPRGQVNAADERDAAVDDDRLLVVAVHRSFACVQRALDAATGGQLIADLTNVAPPGS